MQNDFSQDASFGADTHNSMKALAVLYAGTLSRYALQPVSAGKSAFARCLESASRFPGVSEILVAGSESLASAIPSGLSVPVRTQNPSAPGIASLFELMAAASPGFDSIYFSWADCPYLDVSLTSSLAEKHTRYFAEYTFADGYPYGLTPDILASGIVPIITKLAQNEQGPVTRSVVFDTVKKDINSFDIETDLAPVDARYLRLALSCDTKRNHQLCESLSGITADNYASFIAGRERSLRTLPSYYAVQVSARCPHECVFCPYPGLCRSAARSAPGIPATERRDYMQVADFRNIVAKIEAFSGDAVVSLSLWGECSYHPDLAELAAAVLEWPSLSLLIETTGIGWRKETLETIASLVHAAPARTNGQAAVNWIVSLDAVSSACYAKLHRADEASFREALACTESLHALFPGAVWPQFIRMKENEEELEAFYRFWKEKTGTVIIQKHDHFCKTIEDRRVADLSPLKRFPCWHLKRDLCILVDGTVPLCKEDVFAHVSAGNAHSDSFETVWSRIGERYGSHCSGLYEGLCGDCDEYYTYNF